MPRPRETLSRLERRIVDALYALGEAAAAEVVAHLGQPDAYDSIRVTLRTLERKGTVRFKWEGRRKIYRPAEPAESARRSALGDLVRTFFRGSSSEALLAFLDESDERLSADDMAELEAWLRKHRGRRRPRS